MPPLSLLKLVIKKMAAIGGPLSSCFLPPPPDHAGSDAAVVQVRDHRIVFWRFRLKTKYQLFVLEICLIQQVDTKTFGVHRSKLKSKQITLLILFRGVCNMHSSMFTSSTTPANLSTGSWLFAQN